jgi:predicted Zn-dependent peptidase
VDAELTAKMNKRFVFTVLVAVSLAAASGHARNRLQRPDAGSSATTMAPAILKRQLSNGLRVWIVEQHELPVVQMSLLVLTGTDAEPRGRYGIASLTSAMLTEGAGSRSAVEIADALDGLLGNLSGSSSVDSSSLQLYVPVARLAEALPLMADVSQRPTFPRRELENLRQQRLVTLRNARADPDAIAALAFARGIYGPSHRSAAALIGTADTITALTPEALHAFHESAYRPGNSTLIVVGDVVSDRVLPLLETHFGKWQPASVNGVVQEPAPALQRFPRQLMLIDMPGAPQSRILIGGVGATNSMSDFFPIQVLNTVVRGRLSSDRNPTLRDYTAGVRSGFDMRKSATSFVVAAAAQAHKTAESLRTLVDELTGMAKGIPADELARAKDDIALNFPKTFEATGRISSRLRALESLVVYGLPDNYYANYVPAIQAVGSVDVQRVAQQYIHPDHLTIVIVGDRKTIESSIRALNLGSIKDVSIDEVFAPAR